MKYNPIDNSLFALNRDNFAKHQKPGSLAVFNSSDIMPTSGDGTMGFVQASDLFYLSGIEQEESILLIFPDSIEEKHREVLFIQETNEEIAVWNGPKYTKEQAKKISGIDTIYWTADFERIFRPLALEAERIYLNTNEHLRAETIVETRDSRFLKWCMDSFPLHKYERIAPIMHLLRAVKNEKEIELIRKACEITEMGFRRVLPFIKPGTWEFQVEAELVHEFMKNRSRGPAFSSIIASGPNSCILHYIHNNRKMNDGELLLMDFGAEYANYAGDVTRTIPVNGRFTPRQRAVYQAVLNVQKQATAMLRPGNKLTEYQNEVEKIMEGELVGLGLFSAKEVKNQQKESPLFKKYFMHGTSHHLGLDVHDSGNKYRTLEPGMVLTCEPGIYIREESLGIRLENDILITGKGPVDLTGSIPIEPDEIEDLMAS